MFSSDPGRKQLAESAGFERLVIVTLHRGHTYPSLDSVKEEVAVEAVQLAQEGLPPRKQVSWNTECTSMLFTDYHNIIILKRKFLRGENIANCLYFVL